MSDERIEAALAVAVMLADAGAVEPCPFCGEPGSVEQRGLYAVYCEGCGARSGPARSAADAIRSWNGPKRSDR